MIRAKIIASGSYLPKKAVLNSELPIHLETSDEWIESRTGIKKRHIADGKQTTSDLAANALKEAMFGASILAKDIDGIVVATCTGDMVLPSTAAIVAKKLGVNNCIAFDINAACSGFVHAVAIADSLIKTGAAKRIAVIGAEIMSRVVDWNDRSTCVLFGDGAGAIILEASLEDVGILGVSMESDTSLTDILYATCIASEANMFMNGREVYKHAVEQMSSSVTELAKKCELSLNDINWVVPHQANQRILDAISEKLNIDKGKMVSTIAEHANTSAASIPLAFDEYVKKGKINKGDVITFTAFGAGLSWGSILLKY